MHTLRSLLTLASLLTTGALCAQSPTPGNPIVVVDFGADQSQNTYGLDGWNTVFLSDNVTYSAEGGGGVQIGNADASQCYFGIRGPSRAFTSNDRIQVTWYNPTAGAKGWFYPLVSFTDPDALEVKNDADEAIEPSPQWYALAQDIRRINGGGMGGYGTDHLDIGPGQTVVTFYTITDREVIPQCLKSRYNSAGEYSLINIVPASVGTDAAGLICTKIEIVPADKVPPSTPAGIRITGTERSSVYLEWDPSTDNVGVQFYYIYVDGKMQYYTPYNHAKVPLLTTGKAHLIGITAVDFNGHESSSGELTYTPPDWMAGTTLIDPQKELQYSGCFKLPIGSGSRLLSMTYYPGGAHHPADELPGSLVVLDSGHDVYEFSIPKPVVSPSQNLSELPLARTIKNSNTALLNQQYAGDPTVSNDFFGAFGIGYCRPSPDHPDGLFYYVSSPNQTYANFFHIGAFNYDETIRGGLWDLYSDAYDPWTTEFADDIFSIPQDWANTHLNGQSLMTVGGNRLINGPIFFAFNPWQYGNTLPGHHGRFDFTRLLIPGPYVSNDYFPESLDGWSRVYRIMGADWLHSNAELVNKHAVCMTASKPVGKTWYGFPDGASFYDVTEDRPGIIDYTKTGQRGEYAPDYSYLMLLFDPLDLAKAGSGFAALSSPQPYAALDLGEYFYKKFSDLDIMRVWLHPSYRISEPATDWDQGYVYVLEIFGSTENVLVHVFHIRPASDAPDGFAAWRTANFSGTDLTNDAISGPNADPDRCGLTNFARYAFVLAAHGPVANPISVGATTSSGASYLTLTFPRRTTATDLNYIVESSTDLVTWTAVPGRTYTAGSGPITAQDAVAVGSAPRRFLRLRLTTSP